MVKKLSAVLTALGDAGIRAKRGTLNERAIRPASPVAVVYPEKSAPEELVVAVEVFGTQAVICEDLAYEAVEALNSIRGSCTVEKCQYSGKTGLFSVKILAKWNAGYVQRIYLDNVELTYLSGFSVAGTSETYLAEDGTTTQTEWVWLLTIEELLPASRVPQKYYESAHTVKVVTSGGTEIYSDGRWVSVQRKVDSRGTAVVRTLKCYTRTTE